MPKVLYITDLDGTLLRNDQSLSEATVRCVNAFVSGGGLFTFASARSLQSAGPLTRALSLRLPVITFNGAFIVDAQTGAHAHSCWLDGAEARAMLAAGIARGMHPLAYAHIDGRERVSWVQGRESTGVLRYIREKPGDARLRPVAHEGQLLDGRLFYLTWIDSQARVEALAPDLSGFAGVRAHMLEESYLPGEYWLEASGCDAGKDVALRRLRRMLGVDRVVCFGDNLNDIPLFEAADEGYAVANAQPALKAVATGIIGSNQEDGVAEFLRAREGVRA